MKGGFYLLDVCSPARIVMIVHGLNKLVKVPLKTLATPFSKLEKQRKQNWYMVYELFGIPCLQLETNLMRTPVTNYGCEM